VVGEKYLDIIDAVYRGQAIVPIDTVISFQDGTKQRIKTQVTVVDLIATSPQMNRAA
jgi:long-chain acyl-CoA synthetase